MMCALGHTDNFVEMNFLLSESGGMLYTTYYTKSKQQHSKVTVIDGIYLPHLEYVTAVWDPHLSKDTQELESVQLFACRVCTKSCVISTNCSLVC